MTYNLTVTITGGIHSGKSQAAAAIARALAKSPLYGVTLADADERTAKSQGPIGVLVTTVLHDPVMIDQPVQSQDVKFVTLGELKRAFLGWELDRRAGRLEPVEALDALPAGQVAEAAAACLWGRLD